MFGQFVVSVASVWQSRLVQGALAAMVLPVTATTLKATGLSNDVDPAKLSDGLAQSSLWVTLAAAALFGGLGGVVAELISLRGHIEVPHRTKARRIAGRRVRLADPNYEIDLGIFSRVLLGAAAALALLALDPPGNATSLVVNALIAGSASIAVFRLVQGRMLGKNQPTAADKPSKPAPRSGLSVVPSTQNPAPAPASVVAQ
jgi:hypothetical protein